MAKDNFRIIGRKVARVDGFDKVTGRTRYAADINVAGQLYGSVLHSDYPHAEIIEIDTSDAEMLDGVRGIVTHKDIPGAKAFGSVVPNQAVFVVDKTRYCGDAIAAVAADTPEIAEFAKTLIKVRYNLLPVLSDPRDGLFEGAPPIHPSGNLCKHHQVRKGDIGRGFGEADVIIEREYTTQRVEHSYLEPEAALAELSEDGGVRISGSIQNLFSARRAAAAVLNLPLNKVRLIQSPLGGSFGGKDEAVSALFCRAAILAIKTGKPVKMVNSREVSFRESYKRHPYFMKYKVGAKLDGTLTAMEIDIIADAGAYCCMSPFVTWRSVVQATGPYRVPNVKTDVRAIYTNNVYTGAMRGFGSPQVNFAVESLMDELAEELEMNPVDLRLKNCFVDGDETATGQKLNLKVSVKDAIKSVASRSEYNRKWHLNRSENEGHLMRGIGISCSYRGVSLGAEGTDAASVLVAVQSDGSVIVATGLVDMGQGAATAISIIVAECLDIDCNRIQFLNADTSRVPDSGPTVASRTTLMAGNAAKDACEKLRLKMNQAAMEGLSFDQKAAMCFQRGISLYEVGHFQSSKTTWDQEFGQGDAYFTFVFGANVAEVEVDTHTGKISVKKFYCAHDVGRVISQAGAEGQVTGGVTMGMGYALLEDFSQTDGVPDYHNFDEYLLVTAADIPEFSICLLQNPDPIGPFGAKSLGEPATEIAAPAIANAVYNATGRRVRELPLTLERVLIGKHLSRSAKRGSEVRNAL